MKYIIISLLMSGISYANISKKEFISVTQCMTLATDHLDSQEDLQASYGEEEGDSLHDAQQSILKNDLIRCVRNSKNLCSNKNLDSLVKEKGSKLSSSDIALAVQKCYTGN